MQYVDMSVTFLYVFHSICTLLLRSFLDALPQQAYHHPINTNEKVTDMSTYCMSDIHGQIDAFHQMLKTIHFSDEDTLYIIGDVVDRGPCGVDILREVMRTPNITMILGNHELMMREYLRPEATEKQISRWNRNRNQPTKAQFARLSESEQKAVLDFLWGLPDCKALTVSGKDFFLVHGFPGENTHDRVWNRPDDVSVPNPMPEKILIVGHTPVSYLVSGSDEAEDRYLTKLEKAGKHVEILHAPGFIDLDCSCGYPYHSCALSCLRLDDMQEFYIPVYTDYSETSSI